MRVVNPHAFEGNRQNVTKYTHSKHAPQLPINTTSHDNAKNDTTLLPLTTAPNTIGTFFFFPIIILHNMNLPDALKSIKLEDALLSQYSHCCNSRPLLFKRSSQTSNLNTQPRKTKNPNAPLQTPPSKPHQKRNEDASMHFVRT